MVNLVEAMQQRIFTLGGLFNRGDLNKTGGISALIYNSIRKTANISAQGIDFALHTLSPVLSQKSASHARGQWVSILNGLIGDHLHKTNNPLALSMTFHQQNKQLSIDEVAALWNDSDGIPLLLVHGLCMNDQLWLRNGHSHGEALENGCHCTPIYLRYNSGLAVYQNGLLLAELMQHVTDKLSPKKKINLLCHSMGGLVMRSALHVAETSDQQWHQQISKVVFLGTPHQGAVLEKTGSIIDYLVGINPYSAPFAKVGHLRSHGIKNLRHGTITQDHQTVQLPTHVNGFAIAADTHGNGHNAHQKLIGDGLVSVGSALGLHKDKNKTIQIPKHQQFVINQINHMDLLSSQRVCKMLQQIYTVD